MVVRMYNRIRLGYQKDGVPAEDTAQLDFKNMPREKCQSLIVICYIYEIPGTGKSTEVGRRLVVFRDREHQATGETA